MDKAKLLKITRYVLIALALVVMAVFSVEIIANYKVLTLSDDHKGRIAIDNVQEFDGGTYENGSFSANEPSANITWSFDDEYIDKFSVSYDSDSWFAADVTIGVVNDFGKEEVKVITEANPIELSQSVIDINENVNWIKYTLTGEDTSILISDPTIINEVQFNINRMLITSGIVLSILLLWWFRHYISQHLEFGFLILATSMGICILACLPANKVGWDEEAHFGGSYRLALLPSTEVLPEEIAGYLTVSEYNWPLVQTGSSEESNALSENLDTIYETGEGTNTVPGWTSGIHTPGYVFEAIGIKMAKMFNGSFTDILFAGRLASLISFIVLIFIAIRILPVGKELLLFISCMPTTIFLAVTYNYDIVVFGFIALGLSIILREWLTKDHKISEKCMLLAIPILAYGCLPKAVYAPLVLLPLIIPTDRFKNRKTAVFLKSAYVILFLALMASFVLPQLMGNANNDPRGGDVDSSAQLKLIFSNLTAYIKVFYENVKATFSSYVFGEAQHRLLGHLNTAGFAYLIPMMAGGLILTAERDENVISFTWKDRVYMMILIIMAVGLVWTALYLAYTVPGSSAIGGVQGRYYKPFILLFYLVLCPFKVHMDISKTSYRMILLGICLLILSVTAFQNFLTLCI